MTDFSDWFRRGIVPRGDLPAGVPGMQTLRNMRQDDGMVRPFISIGQPVSDLDLTAAQKAWPRSSLHIGKSKARLFTTGVNGIFSVDTDDWSIAAQEIYWGNRFDLGDLRPGSSTSTGGQWHVMDLYDNFVACNGAGVVWQTGHLDPDKIFGVGSPTIRTCGLYNDSQPFMGGFNPSNIYALADWLTYLKTLYTNADDVTKQAIDALSGGAGQNWAWIGTVGGGDLLWFASLYLMKRGHITQNRINNGWLSTPATTWTVGANWTILAGEGQHSVGDTATLSQTAANQDIAIVVGTQYRVRFTITSRTTGSVTVSLGTASGTPRTVNGTYEELITAAGTGDFAFTPSSDFNGRVSSPAVQSIVAEPHGDNYWRDIILPRNEAAFIPMPFPGEVQHMKQLGDKIMCYGVEDSAGRNGGIAALVPSGKHWGRWQLAEFTSGISIIGRGAVGGDLTQHVIMDDNGELWRITPDLQTQPLQYKSAFANFDAQTIIEYDALEKEFYISYGTVGATTAQECYVLDNNGLSRHFTAPCSVARTQGGIVGMLFAVTGDLSKVVLETHRCDATPFGGHTHEMLTLRSVVVQTLDKRPQGWTLKIRYRMQSDDAWLLTDALTLDKRGKVYLEQSCIEFQLLLEHPDRTQTEGIGALHVDATLGARGSVKHLVVNGPPSAVAV